ncbi:MAG: YceI family protein, partial [Fidelibacterota bacterium]
QDSLVSYPLDPLNSRLVWKGEKVTGKHYGRVQVKSGIVQFRGDRFVGGRVVVDMQTIENLDLESPEYKAKLERHLNSSDFFDTRIFPTAELEVIRALRSHSTKTGTVYNIDGTMTIRGQANPVRFTAEIQRQGEQWQAKGEIVLDRTRWGLRYRSGSFFDDLGDKLIYDEFSISFSVKTNRKL